MPFITWNTPALVEDIGFAKVGMLSNPVLCS
jgi:hypothetical protein